MNTCSTSPACAVLTKLRDWDGIKMIADYAGLPSTSEETKVLDPLMLPEVSHFKPTHPCSLISTPEDVPPQALGFDERIDDCL